MAAAQNDPFLDRLAEFYEGTNTLQAEFRQVKSTPLFDEPIVSSGTFSYAKPEKVRWEEFKPESYYFVLSGDQFSKVNRETGRLEEGSEYEGRIIKRFILGTMDGSLLESGRFEVSVESVGQQVSLHLVPNRSSMRRYIQSIDLTFHRETLFLEQMTMHESEEASTVVTFTEQVRNVPLAESLFSHE